MPRKQIEQRTWIDTNLRKQIFHESNHKCARCGKDLTYSEMTTEHIIPLSKGGTNNETNLICLCETCNKEKSNDIVNPINYYPYLPESKKEDMKQMFDHYIQTVNWFDRDCLFKEDHFTLQAARPLVIERQRKIYYQPIQYNVDKITPQETFNFIQENEPNITPYEKEHTYKSVDEITRPYYRISHNQETLFIASASIEQQDDIVRSEFMQTLSGSNNILLIDLFSNATTLNNYPNKKQAPFNTYKVLEAFLGTIQEETLKRYAPNSIIDVQIQALSTDELASATICQIHKTLYNASNIALNGDTNDFSKGGIIAVRLCITQFNIDKAIGKKKVTAKERKEFLRQTKAQQEIDEQIKNSPTAQQKYQQKLQYNKRHKNTRQTA